MISWIPNQSWEIGILVRSQIVSLPYDSLPDCLTLSVIVSWILCHCHCVILSDFQPFFLDCLSLSLTLLDTIYPFVKANHIYRSRRTIVKGGFEGKTEEHGKKWRWRKNKRFRKKIKTFFLASKAHGWLWCEPWRTFPPLWTHFFAFLLSSSHPPHSPLLFLSVNSQLHHWP